ASESAFTGTSLDNTGELGANAWRHVAFVEQSGSGDHPGLEWFGEDPGLPAGAHGAPGEVPVFGGAQESTHDDFRWLFSSDVCKHCTSAACLEVCPTGAI